MHILIVEDEPKVAQALKQGLEREELAARIRALLRRGRAEPQPRLHRNSDLENQARSQ